MAGKKRPPAMCAVVGCHKQRLRREWCRAHYWRWQQHGDPTAGGTSLGSLARWLEEVALGPPSQECLVWPFALGAKGYSYIRIDGKPRLVNRIVCARAHGPPPTAGLDAAHSCGNAACANPLHLRWATPKSNAADKKLHGTSNIGRRNGSVKLTEAGVRAIRRASGIQEAIASRYGVSRRLVGMIKNRQIWGWLP